jgi:formylglycine-generating enzyme
MKRFTFLFTLTAIILSGCGSAPSGELVGVQGRNKWHEPDPYGMVFIPQGNFMMGPSDQDVMFAQNAFSRSLSVDAFWMDETEITNNKYRQFVYHVRDSIMRRLLGEQIDEFLISEDDFGNELDPPRLNWRTRIDTRNEEINDILEELYYPGEERFWGRKELDPRKLNFEYFWVDYEQAARKSNRWNPETRQYDGTVFNQQGEEVPIVNRSSFVLRDVVNVYPDTLVWISDFTYSYNEPMANMYFWHPSYDEYPVVGITWKQAIAFSIWRTNNINQYLSERGMGFVQNYRLPLESEWEYAARGGIPLSMYPWGGPYTRNMQGCFLANFKPMRGNYTDDGWLYTSPVASFEPNDFGLYDMAGNVAEWTENAYDESFYTFAHDMNPNYKYNALPEDPPVLKRKVIRGGSWKDIAYYLQVSTRTYEYQDTTKSYIGFRNVRSYLGSGR